MVALLMSKRKNSIKSLGTAVLLLFLAIYISLSLYSYHELQKHIEESKKQNQDRHAGSDHATPHRPQVKVNDTRDSLSFQSSTKIASNTTVTRKASFPFVFDKETAERALQTFGADAVHRRLAAYLEPHPLNDIQTPGDRGKLKDKNDHGTPPTFKIPLPLRIKSTPESLEYVEYNQVRSCHDMPGHFPIDRGVAIDPKTGESIAWNVGDVATPDDFPEQEKPFCPVEADPFLPWIHDVFPSLSGDRIEFIAQNKRRCRTGSKFTKDVNRLVPQVALMQAVSVERVSEKVARQLAPKLWHPTDDDGHNDDDWEAPRYRLAPREEASPDGQNTRFICRFIGTSFDESGTPTPVVLGETLSEYPFDYEFVTYRKRKSALLTAKGKDTFLFWASMIRFQCPTPNDPALRRLIASGDSVLSDGTPTIYVDLVPIRTSARYNDMYLNGDMIGDFRMQYGEFFDPVKRWGPKNVLPRFEASGRWANIPICRPPSPDDGMGLDSKALQVVGKQEDKENEDPTTAKPPKRHFLAACLWASAEFKTRGTRKSGISDTESRFVEWLEFHFMVGFDHIYLYDNSGAHTNTTSLADLAAKYPGKITRIDWPAVPCNNNIPAHDSTGERSSQYAAENSCRTRFAPYTEWIAAFDTDEYLVPMGNYTNLKDVIRDAASKGTQVLTFRSSRGKLRKEACDLVDIEEDDGDGKKQGYQKREDATYLEAYNCDSGGIPKPSWAERARKQIYQSDYVLYHFVHYSTVTQSLIRTYKDVGEGWEVNDPQRPPIQRVTDEINEAVMVHAKTTMLEQTANYETHCHKDFEKKWLGCWIAVPWPNNVEKKGEGSYNDKGLLYNCFVNEKVDNYYVPKLKEAMQRRQEQWAAQG